MAINTISCSAFCNSCQRNHILPTEPAKEAAEKLMADLHNNKQVGAGLTTDTLYGKPRGKMFGVLVCRTPDGLKKTLKAFSGQFNGTWEVDRWAPPLFNVQKFNKINTPAEKEIKLLSRQLEIENLKAPDRSQIQQERKHLSRQLMKDIHSLYQLHNFKGQQCTLSDLFPEGNGIPTGTGDCCAPKLLNYAASHNLQPIGLAEFYWGKTNKSDTRHEGFFYPACEEKCKPILGFLLCGL